jgi:zinc protease
VKLERVQAMLADQYVPSNAAVVVSGDCQAADVVAEVVRRFGDWKSADAQPGAALAMPKATSQTQSFAVSGAEERLVTVQIQWAGPSVRESPADDHAADVFVSAVTSAAASVVPRLLASGVIHSVTFSSESQARRGSLTLTAVVTPIGIERALTELRSELDLIANPSFLTEAMVVAGKKNLTVHSEYWFEAGSSLAHTIGYWWTAAGLEYVRDYGDALARVDLAQVQSFVRRYVTGQPFVAGALTPPSYQERVARALAKTFVGNP